VVSTHGVCHMRSSFVCMFFLTRMMNINAQSIVVHCVVSIVVHFRDKISFELRKVQCKQ
jgi:hypothetical protein